MKIILLLVVFLCALAAFSGTAENRSLYFPVSEVVATPDLLGMSYEEVFIRTGEGISLNGWYVKAPVSRAETTPAPQRENPVILFCHGNGGNVGHRVEKIQFLTSLGPDLLIFDYRGYGKSPGKPSERHFYQDAAAALDWLRTTRGIGPGEVILYGESIGGAVAIELASKERVGALITEDTFTSVTDMARSIYPFLPALLIRQRYDSASRIHRVRCPKLFIHSIDDEIVPFRMAVELDRRALPPKQLLKIRGSHNTAFYDSRKVYLEAIREFLERWKMNRRGSENGGLR